MDPVRSQEDASKLPKLPCMILRVCDQWFSYTFTVSNVKHGLFICLNLLWTLLPEACGVDQTDNVSVYVPSVCAKKLRPSCTFLASSVEGHGIQSESKLETEHVSL